MAVFNAERSKGDEDVNLLFFDGCEETLSDALGVQGDIANIWACLKCAICA